MQNVAITRCCVRCCFVTFCNPRQRNEQRIITHAYTTALVAVTVNVCLTKLSETE